MEKKSNIEKTDNNHVDCINIIARQKNGKVQIYLDPKPINKTIKRQPYQLPSFEHIAANITGAKYFTALNATSGYRQIPLDVDSSTLTTFNDPFGKYNVLRLPFGLNILQEHF